MGAFDSCPCGQPSVPFLLEAGVAVLTWEPWLESKLPTWPPPYHFPLGCVGAGIDGDNEERQEAAGLRDQDVTSSFPEPTGFKHFSGAPETCQLTTLDNTQCCLRAVSSSVFGSGLAVLREPYGA